MKTYRDMIDGLLSRLKSGEKLEDIQPYTIAGLTAEQSSAVIAQATTDTSGESVVFHYFDHKEFYLPRQTKTKQCDEWTEWDAKWAIYQTDKAMRPAGQEGWDATRNLHVAIDRAIAPSEKYAYVELAKGTSGPADWQIAGMPGGVTHVFYPRKYESDNIWPAMGKEWLFASPKFTKLEEGWTLGEEIDGVVLYHKHDATGSVKLLASYMHDNEGVIDLTEDPATYARLIATACGGAVAVDGIEVTQEMIASYEQAKALLASVATAGDGDRNEVERIKTAITQRRQQINDYLERVAAEQTELNKQNALLARIEIPKDVYADYLETTISTVEEILAKEPVKSVDLIKGGLKIALHPVVVDCGEQENYDEYVKAGSGKDYLANKGEPRYRYLPNLEFEMKLEGTSNPNAAIKWLKPTTLPEGQEDRRCHPHIQDYEGGRACWGEAAAPIAGELSTKNFADAVDWIFAWCAGIRRDDTICYTHKFAPAAEGSTLGWVIPERAEGEKVLVTA